jgi:hypothetical protein
MLSRTSLGLLTVVALAAASCAAPPTKQEAGPPPLSEAAVRAAIRELSEPYPTLQVTDYTTNGSGTSACAYIRVADKRPYVIHAFNYLGRLRVAGPILTQPGSWDLQDNAELSDVTARHCQSAGVSLPAS